MNEAPPPPRAVFGLRLADFLASKIGERRARTTGSGVYSGPTNPM
jgi:hypothetical protein